MKFYELKALVEKRMSTTTERYGQAFSNVLAEINPEVYKEICDAGLDPFYLTSEKDIGEFHRKLAGFYF